MAIVRYEMPGSTGTSSDEARARFGEFFSNPLLAVTRLLQPKPFEPFYFPVVVDTERGTVGIETPAKERRGRDAGLQQQRFDEANTARGLLEQAYASGVVPPGTPRNYREIAELLTQLEHDQVEPNPAAFDVFEREAEPATPEPDPYQEFSMAGYIPPGGVAGFAQMAPASRIALTKGTNGGGARRRRAKKAKPTRRKRVKASGRRGRKRLVKGSAAAKRFMANLRKRRRK